ncbi:MAG: hypothetical protein IT304_07600 [Dehalococcoidia bacterium]|nr:hypothetical protein [Dehalococcoidia bacterium]
MSLPVVPDTETILRSCARVLQDVVLPGLEDDWQRFSAALMVGSLQYAIGVMHEDRGAAHRAELATAIAGLKGDLAEEELGAAAANPSPFEVASAMLVWAEEHPGAQAEAVRAALYPVLYRQMEQEAAAATPMMEAFGVAMRGRKDE